MSPLPTVLILILTIAVSLCWSYVVIEDCIKRNVSFRTAADIFYAIVTVVLCNVLHPAAWVVMLITFILVGFFLVEKHYPYNRRARR